MSFNPELEYFFDSIRGDARIGPAHISLFMAILQLWNKSQGANPVSLNSKDVMPLAKISGIATYHKVIQQLHEYGYIQYIPSHNHFSRSLVYLLPGQKQ